MASSIPKTMRAVEISSPGGPENLRLTERPIPVPGPQEVLIRVAAAGVNRPDVLQRMGLYPPPPGASDIPGLEVAGEVVATGKGAVGENVGDKVCALLSGGGYAEYAVVHEGSCLPVPSTVSLTEAAGLPETFFTVWANVFEDGGLRGGETLLVHGASSGIGVAAISLAKALGANVFATASSAEKLAAAKKLGADEVCNYETDKWEEVFAEKGGVDVVLDMAGGAFVARNLACMRERGRHVSIAFLRGSKAEIDVPLIMRKRLRLSGSTLRAREDDEKSRLCFDIRRNVWPLLEAKRLRPVVDKVFPLADAAKAHQRMEAGDHIGKIILDCARPGLDLAWPGRPKALYSAASRAMRAAFPTFRRRSAALRKGGPG